MDDRSRSGNGGLPPSKRRVAGSSPAGRAKPDVDQRPPLQEGRAMTQRQADSTTERLFRLPALVALCLMVAGCGGSPGGAPPGGADTGATLGTGIGSGT